MLWWLLLQPQLYFKIVAFLISLLDARIFFPIFSVRIWWGFWQWKSWKCGSLPMSGFQGVFISQARPCSTSSNSSITFQVFFPVTTSCDLCFWSSVIPCILLFLQFWGWWFALFAQFCDGSKEFWHSVWPTFLLWRQAGDFWALCMLEWKTVFRETKHNKKRENKKTPFLDLICGISLPVVCMLAVVSVLWFLSIFPCIFKSGLLEGAHGSVYG